jgi:hypothetical protein
MWHVFDIVLTTFVVVLCCGYALYSLSSANIKRAVLTLLVRCFGTRVFSVFSPRISGCDNCAPASRDLQLGKKPKS